MKIPASARSSAPRLGLSPRRTCLCPVSAARPGSGPAPAGRLAGRRAAELRCRQGGPVARVGGAAAGATTKRYRLTSLTRDGRSAAAAPCVQGRGAVQLRPTLQTAGRPVTAEQRSPANQVTCTTLRWRRLQCDERHLAGSRLPELQVCPDRRDGSRADDI